MKVIKIIHVIFVVKGELDIWDARVFQQTSDFVESVNIARLSQSGNQ